jgi:hypothetical protein
VQGDPRVAREPGAHRGVFVDGVVVHDQVQLFGAGRPSPLGAGRSGTPGGGAGVGRSARPARSRSRVRRTGRWCRGGCSRGWRARTAQGACAESARSYRGLGPVGSGTGRRAAFSAAAVVLEGRAEVRSGDAERVSVRSWASVYRCRSNSPVSWQTFRTQPGIRSIRGDTTGPVTVAPRAAGRGRAGVARVSPRRRTRRGPAAPASWSGPPGRLRRRRKSRARRPATG